MPALHKLLDAESAHELAIRMAKHGLVPHGKDMPAADASILVTIFSPRLPILITSSQKTTVMGMSVKNPIGLAAGFDKNGDGVKGLVRMGFGFVEVGSVTPKPQDGNPKPRVFRLLRESAIINRCVAIFSFAVYLSFTIRANQVRIQQRWS